jgi:hypothetical protein
VVTGGHDELVAQEFVAAVDLEPAVKILNSTSYSYKNIYIKGSAFYAIQNKFRTACVSN